MNRLTVLLCLSLFFLGACSPARSTESSAISLSGSTPDASAIQSATTTPTPSPSPTATATKTRTPTPTLTPTLDLPIRPGTPFPDLSLPPITAENANRLELIAKSGGIRTGQQLLVDNRTLVVGDAGGLTYYDIVADKQTGRVWADMAAWETWQAPRLNGNSQTFSVTPDGRHVLLVGLSGAFEVWAKDGERVTRGRISSYDPERVNDQSAALSPDGSLLALAGCGNRYKDCIFKVVRISDGQEAFAGKGNYPSFSPDGSRFSINFDKKIDIYDTADWKRIVQLPEMVTEDFNWRKEFSPDGALLALLDEDAVTVWRIADRKLVRTIATGPVKSKYAFDPVWMMFSPDSTTLLLGPSGWAQRTQIQAVTLASGEIQATPLEAQKVEQGDYAYWMDRFYWLDANNQIQYCKLYDPENSFPIYQAHFVQLVIDKDVRMVADWRASAQTLLCDFTGCQNAPFSETVLSKIETPSGQVYSLQKTGDGISLYRDGVLVRPLRGGEYSSIRAATDQTLLMTSEIGYSSLTQVIDLQTGQALRSWPSRLASCAQMPGGYALVINPGGVRVSVEQHQVVFYAEEGNAVRYQEQGYGQLIANLDDKTVFLVGEDYSPDAYSITTLPWETPKEADTITFTLAKDDQERFSVQKAIYSPATGMIAFGTYGGWLYLYDTRAETLAAAWPAHGDEISALAFSPDGSRLASFGLDDVLKIWGVVEPE